MGANDRIRILRNWQEEVQRLREMAEAFDEYVIGSSMRKRLT